MIDFDQQTMVIAVFIIFFLVTLFSVIMLLTMVRQARHLWGQDDGAEVMVEAGVPAAKTRDTGTFPAARISPLPERWRTSTLMPVLQADDDDTADDHQNVQVLIDFLKREAVQPIG